MKRSFRNFIFAVLALVGIGVGFTFVNAADEPVNEVLLIHENTGEVNKAITESKTGDNQKSTGTGVASSVITTATWMLGPQALTDPAILDAQGLSPELRHGLLDLSTSAMMYSFIQGPTGNIPSYYAEMLLPEPFKSAGSTAYAAVSPGPDTTTSSAFLGEDALGINKLWGVSFSIAMSAVVIVLMVAGFMVMFRSKLGGQTTVTVMMALQNIIIGSILALASYALGVFFLNLSKYLILMIAYLLEDQLGATGYEVVHFGGPGEMIKEFLKVTVWGSTLGGDFSSFLEFSKDSILTDGSTYRNDPSWWERAKAGFNLVAAIPKAGVGILVGLIARLVIAFAITVATLKVFWAVVQTYIKMIIDIILAPIVMIFTSLPGKQAGFGNWMKKMFQNSLAIPIMFAFMNVAAYMSIAVGYATTGGCAVPDGSLLTCITAGTIPAGASSGTDWLILVIGPSSIVTLVMLNMVPTVPQMMQELIAGKGDYSKSLGAVTKNLQSIPGVGGMFS